MKMISGFNLFVRQALLYPLTSPFLPAIEDVKEGVIYGGGSLIGIYKNMYKTFVLGEDFSAGDIGYLKSDGKMWKAKANIDTTSKGLLGLCPDAGVSGASVSFLIKGDYITSGLSVSAIYYLSVSTFGAKTSTMPVTSTNILRILGYSTSTINFYFNPSSTYVTVV